MLLAQTHLVSSGLLTWILGVAVSCFAIAGGVITILKYTRDRIQDQIQLSLSNCPFKDEYEESIKTLHNRIDDMSKFMVGNQINGDIVDLNRNLKIVAEAISPELGRKMNEIHHRQADKALVTRLTQPLESQTGKYFKRQTSGEKQDGRK